MPDRVDPVMKTIKPPVSLAPGNRMPVESAGLELAEIDDGLGLRSDSPHPSIFSKAGFCWSYRTIPALGGFGDAAWWHGRKHRALRVADQGLGVPKAPRV